MLNNNIQIGLDVGYSDKLISLHKLYLNYFSSLVEIFNFPPEMFKPKNVQ